MKEIDIFKLFEFYIEPFQYCGKYTKYFPDEFIETYIFENLIITSISFLYKSNLDILFENDLINQKIYNYSLKFREGILKLENTSEWNIKSFKSSNKWNKLINLSDIIKQDLVIFNSLDNQMNIYLEFIKNIKTDFRNYNDISILNYIFIDFTPKALFYLSDMSLDRLITNNLIDHKLYSYSRELRNLTISFYKDKLEEDIIDIKYFKNSNKWNKILEMIYLIQKHYNKIYINNISKL